MGDSNWDGLLEINLLQPRVWITPTIHSSAAVKWSVSHRAPISVLGPCGKPVLELNNAFGDIFKFCGFLTPGICRSESEVHHARQTDIFPQCLLSWLWVTINYTKDPKHSLTIALASVLPFSHENIVLMIFLLSWMPNKWVFQQKDLQRTGVLLSLPSCV